VDAIQYHPFTYDQVLPHLWIGSAPPPGRVLRVLGVQTLVLCAAECKEDQSPPTLFEGVEVIYAPFDDPMIPGAEEFHMAELAAGHVADRVRAGRRTLVTCFQGHNRSGLVCALALHRVLGWSGERAVAWVRDRRARSLRNQGFVRYLETKGRRRRA